MSKSKLADIRGQRRNKPDQIFQEANPCNFMARQRFLSHKSAQNEVEDYDKKSIANQNPDTPLSWEEVVVNVNVLDMLERNQLYEEIDMTKGFSTFSYPHHMDKIQGGANLTKNFVESINRHIIGREFSEYNIINQALYQSLMGNHKVQLAEMPEILLRQIIGGSLSLEELKDVLRFLMEKLSKLDHKISFREACHDMMPHIFNGPKDLYMTAMLREAFQAATCIVGYVGLSSLIPIKEYWIPPPHGISFSEATRIPERMSGETDEDLIEKQALLDAIQEKRAWGERYIVNPFPYITKDITEVNGNDLTAMKQCYMFHYKKYEAFKNMDEGLKIPSYADRKISIMQNPEIRLMEELEYKEMKKRLQNTIKIEAKDLYDLKIENWDKKTGKRPDYKKQNYQRPMVGGPENQGQRPNY